MAHTSIWTDVMDSGVGFLAEKTSLAVLNFKTKETSAGADVEPPKTGE